MVVSFGGKLKDVAVGMTEYMRERGGDFLRPQLLFALPFSTRRNTTWATIRGWKIPDFYEVTGRREQRVKKMRLIKAYGWVMCISDQLPKLGLNGLGTMGFEDMLTTKEMGFMELGAGGYALCLLRHTIKSEMRVGFGSSSEHFYTTDFPLTRSSVKFDGGEESALVVEESILINQLDF
ncbi:unnamed protein product [Cuscuta campestris]|uniref:Uncharacterized protein n=1 Tax=Cuscuta campestris TaxID=132261 RepID=A0A484L782_9ASTE|nr:unnamed protein product [Cuscuta campestris]